jgi:hypothetical protein
VKSGDVGGRQDGEIPPLIEPIPPGSNNDTSHLQCDMAVLATALYDFASHKLLGCLLMAGLLFRP